MRTYKFPLAQDDYVEIQCMALPITRVRVSRDDQYVFATGEDGSLAVLELREKDGAMSLEPAGVGGGGGESKVGGGGGGGECKAGGGAESSLVRMPWSEEILVTKSDLEENTAILAELQSKVEELTLHNEYQLRLKDMDYNEKIKEVTEKYTQELEQDKNKFELLREEKNDLEMEFEEKIKQMEEQHVHESQEVEASYQQKIMSEVERYVEESLLIYSVAKYLH